MIDLRYAQLAVLVLLFARGSLVAQETAEPATRLVCSLKADGTDLQQLLQVDDSLIVSSPAVSPVGTQIVFSSWDNEDGETRPNSRVARLRLDGGTLTGPPGFVLGDGAMPSWSPRGKRIVLTRFGLSRGVWIMKSDGTQKVLLDRRGVNAKWSPNGHMVAYSKSVRSGRTIAIYDMVEDRNLELWENSGSPFERIADSFAWSPDSRKLCLRVRRPVEDTGQEDEDLSEIVTVPIHDVSKLTVHESCEDGQFPTIAWHPDGKRIVFSKRAVDGDRTQLYWFDPTTDGRSQPLLDQDSTRDNANACWTRDGSRLVFVSTTHQEPEDSLDLKPASSGNTDD